MTAEAANPIEFKAKVNRLAEVFIEVVKDMAGRGRRLTAESLGQVLLERPEVAEVLALARPAKDEAAAIEGLKARQERLTRQKGELLKKLADAEEEAGSREDFFRRALLTVLRLIQGVGGEEVGRAIESFRQTLLSPAEKTDLAGLEELLQAVKTGLLRDEAGRAEKDQKDKSGSFWERLFKTAGPQAGAADSAKACLPQIQAAYLEVLSEVDLDLDPDYLKKLTQLRHRIRTGEDLDYLVALRQELVALIRRYSETLFQERRQATAFMAEMVKRLAEIDRLLLSSLDRNQGLLDANRSFNQNLSTELDDFSSAVADGRKFEELKSMVLERLGAFKNAVAQKQREDETRFSLVAQEMASLKRQVVESRQEADRVQEENAGLQTKIRVDPLTGALNRRAGQERLEEEMSRFQRHNRPFAVIFLDVDHFKNLNDTYGHAAGDRCLQEIVRRVKILIRKADSLVRYGGEEFFVLLPETTRDQALEVAEKLRLAVAGTDFVFRGQPVPVTASFGLTQVEPADEAVEAVLQRADQAMYQAKTGGRNRVVAI